MLQIQITGQIDGRALAAMADQKYLKESVLRADRGKIVDRAGEVIATDTLSYRLVAVLSEKASKGSKKQQHVTDFEKTADVLSQYLDMDRDAILERFQNAPADAYQIEFGKAGRSISNETADALKKEELPGIRFFEDKKRLYPNGKFASYLVGFAMPEEMKDKTVRTVGKMGLEKTYDKQLTGTDGKMNLKTDRWGIQLRDNEKQIEAPKNGQTIQLTLDKTIQNFVEDALNRAEKEYKPEKMLAVVVNPKTGEILAMSQRPSFHPGTREGLTDNWLNEAVEETFEPGSTMKMFTLAAAIQENKWDPNAFYKSGEYKIYDRTIRDVNRTGWGTITYLEGFQRSSNVSMAYLLERMGDQTFIDYLKKFGFGKKVGIDLPNEASGIILDNYPSERLTTSYGQGSTVTPIQMIQAATAIANDGNMMTPYVIDQIIDPNTEKVVEQHSAEAKKSPISEETAKRVREVLASTITSEHGTGKKFALDGYDAGGKTGTAQIPRTSGKGYRAGNGNYLYSFLGMAPIDDPQLLTYVLVQHPQLKEGKYGSDPTSEIFTSVMESSLKYLNIAPDSEHADNTVTMENYEGAPSGKTAAALKEKGLIPVITGEAGDIAAQSPAAGTELTPGSVVMLQTSGNTLLPDFTGWSKRQILTFKSFTDLDIRVNGEGYVVKQSLSAGSAVTESDPVVITLEEPEQMTAPETEEEPGEESPSDGGETEEDILGG
ncbi:penicillin-binding protein [Sporosarcina koreensis]|uniref:penicillin-binding protein n=1 Tax=Sporosarcina koreensis TaxID=334735 RepID=UPI001FD060EA|nr:penicillin-binding protein [Sporosarcina koreensis]